MMRWLGLWALAAMGSFGCGESRLVDDFTDQATRLRIVPEAFRGSVPCATGVPGALQTYAVRFQQEREAFQVSDAGLWEALSPAVPCDRAVVLDAVPGRLYGAQVYGFDRVFASGEAPVLDQARWTAECGKGEDDSPLAPTRAVFGTMSYINGCTKFSGEGSSGTSLVVDQASALGSLTCGSLPGQVWRLEGVLGAQRVSALCGQPLAFELPGVAGFHTIELTAFEASPMSAPVTPPPPPPSDPLDASVPEAADAATDAAPPAPLDAGVPPAPPPLDAGSSDAGADPGVARWRSQCAGRSLPGATATATCEPLQPLAAQSP